MSKEEIKLHCEQKKEHYGEWPEIDSEEFKDDVLPRTLPELTKKCSCECVSGKASIPRIVQFVKTDDTFNAMEWLAVLAALKYINPERIIVHSLTQMKDCWWNRTLPLVQHNVVTRRLWDKINRIEVSQPAHQADFLRLIALYERGGIYMDTDALTMKSFDPLLASRKNVFAWGSLGFKLKNGIPMAGNGLMIAPRRSCFICQFMQKAVDYFDGDVWSVQHSNKLLASMLYGQKEEVMSDVLVLPLTEGFFDSYFIGSPKLLRTDADKLDYNVTPWYSLHLYHTTKVPKLLKYFYDFDYLTKAKTVIANIAQHVMPSVLTREHFDDERCLSITYYR